MMMSNLQLITWLSNAVRELIWYWLSNFKSKQHSYIFIDILQYHILGSVLTITSDYGIKNDINDLQYIKQTDQLYSIRIWRIFY